MPDDGPGWWRSLDLDQDWLGLWTALVLRLGYIRRLDFCFIPSLVQGLFDLLPGGILNLLTLQVFLRFGFCAKVLPVISEVATLASFWGFGSFPQIVIDINGVIIAVAVVVGSFWSFSLCDVERS